MSLKEEGWMMLTVLVTLSLSLGLYGLVVNVPTLVLMAFIFACYAFGVFLELIHE